MTTNTPKTSSHYAARPIGPHANSAVCKFLKEKVSAIAFEKKPEEIALEIGYTKPNVLLMILNGDTRLPLDKVQPLAKALQVDQKLLFRLALEAHCPSLRGFLDEIFEVNH